MRVMWPRVAHEHSADALPVLRLCPQFAAASPAAASGREAAVSTVTLIEFVAVCVLASVVGAAALRWMERKPPTP